MSFNEYSATKSTKNVLGGVYDIKVKSTYYLYKYGRKVGALNCGTTLYKDQEKKVYIVGLDDAVTSFRGQILAIAKDRLEQMEDIWIAAPNRTVLYEPRLIPLLEKYIPSDRYKYVCYYEKSCGAVMYTENAGVRKFMLITNISGHVGFPKGHIEVGENEKATARREIYEETGVKAELIDGFRECYNYIINGFIRKRAVYFLAHFDTDDIRMNIREISEYRLLTLGEAMEILNFQHDRDILQRANDYIDRLNKK